jgi:Protein of unknown function (DUF4232)
MRDDQLREGMAAWLGPVQQAPAPDAGVIRRRLRRRRARQAATGTVVCALAVAAALTVAHGGAAPAPSTTGPSPAAHPPCRSSQLRVDTGAALVRTGAVNMEPLPDTYLLRIRNTGRAACSLSGWPRLSIAAPRSMRSVPVSYGTLITRPARHGETSRVIEPAEVTLPAQAEAAAMVVVTYPLAEQDCATATWSVTPPRGDRPTIVRRVLANGPRRQLLICGTSAVTVSPVYPATVPVTQNYPRSAPQELPGSLSASLPASGAEPGAAPYFMVLRRGNAVVYDWRTGRVTARIRPPGTAPQGFTGVAAAGDDRTFVLAAGTGHSRFYQVALGQDGTVSQLLAQLPVPPVADSGSPFALAPDATELALALPQPGGVAADEIMVVSLADGATRIWRSPDPGLVYAMSWDDPLASPGETWSGHPRLLFGWTDSTRARRTTRQRSGLRLLDPRAPGTSLLGSRLLIPASARVGALRTLNYPLITAAGTFVFATMTSHVGGNARAAVVAFSAATGRPLGVVTPLAGESGFGTWCGALWANASGSAALAACGVQGMVNGAHFGAENLHFPAPNLSVGSNFFAW